MAIKIKHSLQFITELDEKNSTAQMLMSLPKKEQKELLELILKEVLAPRLEPILKELNENNSYATLKVVA